MDNMQMGDSGDHSEGDMDMDYAIDYGNLTADELRFMNRPWLTKTMPGRTGNFLAHFIPAIFYIGFGVSLLIMSLVRSRNIPPGRTFAELYIPETNPLVLRRFGYTIASAAAVGIMFEGGSGIYSHNNPLFQLAHQTLYLGYFVSAFCAILESQRMLSYDTNRAALVVCLVASYLIWSSHGAMKHLPADQSLHLLLGYINLVNAFVVMYSMRFTDSVLAYLANWILMILQGLWLLIAGAYECCVDLPVHDVGTYLAALALLLTLFITLIYIAFGPGPQPVDTPDSIEFRTEFVPLRKSSETDESEDDDNEAC